MEKVRLIFQLAAEGRSTDEIAVQLSLERTHVAEIATNAIYKGVLRDGSRRPPVIDDLMWTQVQEMRARHSHRHPGPVAARQYLWAGLLQCRVCGRHLTGHVARYRHVGACDAFRAARPGGTKQAMRRLELDRDVAAWKATMERLDREEGEAHVADGPSLTSIEIVDSLRDLQSLFADAEPATQHRIVAALFEQVEVLGPSEVWLYPTVEAEARGWAAAMAGEFRIESTYGRGERI